MILKLRASYGMHARFAVYDDLVRWQSRLWRISTNNKNVSIIYVYEIHNLCSVIN